MRVSIIALPFLLACSTTTEVHPADAAPPPDVSATDAGGAPIDPPIVHDAGRDAGASRDAGIAHDAGSPSTEPVVWPNAGSRANSSTWLRQNHDRLRRIEPRVLVLDVVQGPNWPTPARTLVDRLVASFGEMSRYHGYSDTNAPVFLDYRVDRIVDLRDPGGAEYPSFWPQRTNGGFDVGELFSDAFAPRLGYRDPENPSRYLTMCELFERGVVNELWIAAGSRNIFENQSRMQKYDAEMQPIPGQFLDCTNGCFYDPRHRVSCSVTVRMQELNKSRGPGCGTHAAGHALENVLKINPYLAANATRFFNLALRDRYGIPIDSAYSCGYGASADACFAFPSPTTLSNGSGFPGRAFRFDGWGQGCGNVHFAPNSRYHYDYYDSQHGVANACEGYGLGEGEGGRDRTSSYTSRLVADYESRYGDCGGGWQVYMGQSMPGLDNRARDSRGRPMKNWWPFLFY